MSSEAMTGHRAEALAYGVLASFMDASPDVVRIIDLEGRLECVNREGRRLLGITDFGPLRGAHWPSLWPLEARARLSAALAAAADGQKARFEARCPTSDGVDRWWDTVVTGVRDGTGRVVRILATSRDITELRDLRACAADSGIAALRSGYSRHDLMTPLHGLLGMAALLDGTGLSPEQQGMLDTIRDCGEALVATLSPANDLADRQSGAGAAAAKPDGCSAVLVVDDNHVNRELLRLTFEAIGVNVTTAENGAQACELCEAGAYDLVIMDLQMPVMDGLAAIRRIRGREVAECRSRTPVVVLTANGAAGCELASRAAGADGFLMKPLSPTALIGTISSVLHDGRAAGVAGDLQF